MKKRKSFTSSQYGLSHTARLLSKYYGSPPDIEPIEVKVGDGGFESAFRKFKVLFQREKVVGKLKEKQQFEKPSEKRRRKRREAHERRLLTESRERMMASGEWEKRQKRKAIKRQQRVEQKVRQQEASDDYGKL